MESADTLAARLAYQNPLEVADAIEADRAAVALAVLTEVETEALRQYREHVGPADLTNDQKLKVAAGSFRDALDTLRARYQKETE